MSRSSNIFLLLWFLIFLNTACSNNNETHKPISLEPVKNISEINDSTFFGGLGVIKYQDNRFYLADNLPQVLQLGIDLDLIGVINKTGRGPGEFIGVMDMSVVNDSLYLYDRQQAKILVYDDNNHFIREVRLPEAFGYDMVVDHRSQIFLSTPNSPDPITKLDANGKKIMSFGNTTVSNDSGQYRRNSRFLFIHDDKLIAIAMSEPVLEVYSLEGKFISSSEIDPPEMHDLIERAKRENEEQLNPSFLSLIFYAAAIYEDSIYLMEAKRTNEDTNEYDTNFSYLFKYKLEPDGDVTFERTFRLFHSDPEELLYGFRLAAVGDHKLIVYDLMGRSLLLFQHDYI